MRNNRFWPLVVAMIVVVVVALTTSAQVVYRYTFNESLNMNLPFLSSTDTPKEEATVTQNANFTNWGFACETEDAVYYSDCKTGIYVVREGAKAELFSEGVYSDMCTLGDEIYCAESTESGLQYVKMDRNTGDKYVINNAGTIESIGMQHKTNGKVYYTINSRLYATSDNGKTKYTKISNVKKVTDSGVYVTGTNDRGLRLLSFKGKEKQWFSNLGEYTVDVLMEADGYVYLCLFDLEEETTDFVKMDVASGEYTSLPYQNAYGTLTNLNYYDGKIYMTFYKKGKCYVCKTDATSESEKVTLIKSVRTSNETFNPISIVGDKIYLLEDYDSDDVKLTQIRI